MPLASPSMIRTETSVFFSLLLVLAGSIAAHADHVSSADVLNKFLSSDQVERQYAEAFIARYKPVDLLPLLRDVLTGKNDLEIKLAALRALKLYPLNDTLSLWLDLLRDSNSIFIKKQVIDDLASFGDRRTVLPLVDELSSPFLTVRESAALALKRIGDDRMFPLVLNMARNPNPIYRVYALEAIYHLYDRRFHGLLLDLLRDENKSVRYYVIKCIEKNRLIDTLPQIRNMAFIDQNWEVRIKAIDTIRAFKDRGSVPVLLRCLNESNRDIRYASAAALRDLQVPHTAFAISSQLAAEQEDDIKFLLLETLIRLRSSGGFAGLQKVLLADTNARLRIRAAYALGVNNEIRSVPLLLQGLDDADYRVKSEACYSLSRYRGLRHTSDKLMEIVNEEKDLYVRTAALYSLTRLGDRRIILPFFDLYGIETDPVFKEKLRIVLRRLIER